MAVTMSKGFRLVIENYRENGLRSIENVEGRIKNHLLPFWFGLLAHDVTVQHIRQYVQVRLVDGASNATINRELAIISKAFDLLISDGLLPGPAGVKIRYLKEDNARQGFLSKDELDRVCKYLEPAVADLIQFCAITGWRWQSEAAQLQWKDVDFDNRLVRLPSQHAKNGQPRVFPFTDRLDNLLRWRYQASGLQGPRSVLVFTRDGHPIRSFRRQWASACRKAGVEGRVPHDLRRSAVRDFERAGIPRSVAMKLSGHKTEHCYRRYAIVCESDLQAAAAKLNL